jgi:hypothetical protein
VCRKQNPIFRIEAFLFDWDHPLVRFGFPQGGFCWRNGSRERDRFRCAAVREGKTLRRITNGGKFGAAVVSLKKFKYHCALYPEWGEQAMQLAKANSKAADVLKGLFWRERTKDLCLKGLHPMTGANVRIDPSRGRRACLACRYIARDNPPLIKPDVLVKIRQAFEAGASYGQICNGRPVGGGKIDRSLMSENGLIRAWFLIRAGRAPRSGRNRGPAESVLKADLSQSTSITAYKK